MSRRPLRSSSLLAALLAVAGCLEVPASFHCASSDQCVRGAARGTCEPTGWCSLPDAQCPSGRRYASAAGDGLGENCVSAEASCGVPGKPCCGGDTCSSQLYQCRAGMCEPRPCADGVTAGNAFSCAHRADGTAWCWGDNSVGQLGNGMQGNRSVTPVPVLAASGGSGSLGGLEHVFLGAEFGCAHDEKDKLVYCWGRNDSGQLGNGTTDQSPRPVRVLGSPGGTPFTGAVGHAAGGHHACVWDNVDGALWCWGDNQYGQLGRGNTITNDPKIHVPGAVLLKLNQALKQVVVVAAGGHHTCAAQLGGTLYCWGHNDAAQLGNATLMSDHEAMPVPVLAAGGGPFPRVTALGAGESHTCAVADDGSVWCWGASADGQLGDGKPGPASAVPVQALPAGAATLVAGGARHTCALGRDRKVRCWGGNGVGQLGTGSLGNPSSTPVEVKGLTGVVDLAVGQNHACAARSDGTVWCWGGNEGQQLGTSDGTASATPVQVPLRCDP